MNILETTELNLDNPQPEVKKPTTARPFGPTQYAETTEIDLTPITPETLFNPFAPHEPYEKPKITRAVQSIGSLDLALRASQDLPWALKTAWGMDSKVAAETAALAKSLRIDDSNKIVFTDMVQVRKVAEVKRAMELLTATDKDGNLRNPYTVKWFLNPKRAAMGKDSIDALVDIERWIIANKGSFPKVAAYKFADESKRLIKAGLGTLVKAPGMIREQNENLQAFAADIIRTLSGGLIEPDEYDEALPTFNTDSFRDVRYIREMLNVSDEELSMFEDRYLQAIHESDLLKPSGIPELATSGMRKYALDVVGIGPQIVGAMTAAVITGNPAGAAAFMGTYIFGDTYFNMREYGVSDQRAETAAFANAIFQAPLEQIGIGKLLGAFKAKGAREVLKKAAGAMGTEWFTEFLQSFVESGTTIYGLAELEGLSFEEQLDKFFSPENLKDTAIQGAYEGLIAATFFGLSSAAPAIRQSIRAEQHLQLWQGINERAKTSKLIKDNKEVLGEAIEGAMAEHDAPTSILIAPDAVRQFHQAKNEDPDEYFEKLGIDKDSLDEADLLGGDIEIPVSKYFEVYGGEADGTVLDQDIRWEPGGFTQRELSELKGVVQSLADEQKAVLAKMTQKVDLPPELEAIRTKLMTKKKDGGFGMMAKDADAYVGVFLAGARQLSQKQGEDVAQWFKRVNPRLVIDETAEKRGAVDFRNTETIVNLYQKSSDLSTFLHEIAHVFVDDMINAQDMNEELKTDLQALEKFAGGKLTRDNTEAMEKVARGFEAYLRTGKAPSVALMDAFRRFFKWLQNIYAELRQLDVELNSEVISVFDRMLATENEISEAMEFYHNKEAFKSLYETASPAQKKKLDTLAKKTKEEAIDKAVTKHLNAYYKAQESKSDIQRRIAEELDAAPLYRAMDEIKEQKGFDHTDLVDQFTLAEANQLKINNPATVNRKKGAGKANLSALAAKYNFASEELFMRALMDNPSRANAAKLMYEQETDRIISEIRQGVEAQEHTPGDEVIHNDAHLSFLVAQMHIYADKLEKSKAQREKKLNAQALKAAARELIMSMPISKARQYSRFARTEQKFANEAFKWAQKGDWDKAYEAKQKEALNHALVIESVKIREEAAKIIRNYGAKKISASLKTTENTFRNVVIDLLTTFKLTKGKLPELEMDDPLMHLLYEDGKPGKGPGIDPRLYDSLPGWVSRKNPPDNFEGWGDLSFEELEQLHVALKSIFVAGKDEMLLLEFEGKKKISEFVDASVDGHMVHLKDKKVHDTDTGIGKALDTTDGMMSYGLNFDFVFEHMDNFKYKTQGVFGPLRQLYRTGVKVATQFHKIRQNTVALMQDNLKTLNGAKKRMEENGKTFQIEGVPVKEGMIKTGRPNWTAGRVISFMLNMGNAQNKMAMSNSYGYSPDQVAIIAAMFTKDELQAIQGVWNAIDTLFPDLDATHFRMYNRHLDRIQAEPITFQAKDGQITLEGGYYPLIYDHKLDTRAAKYREESELEEAIKRGRHETMFHRTRVADRATKKRQKESSMPPLLDMTVLFDHVNEVSRYISHAEYLRDVNRITLDEKWAAMFKQKAGAHNYRQLRAWVSHLASPERRVADLVWGRQFEKQRHLATAALLSLKFGVGLKQRLSMFAAANEVGWGRIITAVGDMGLHAIMGNKNSEAWQRVINTSDYMNVRSKAIDRDMYEALNKFNPALNQFEVFSEQGMFGKHFKRDITIKDVRDFMFEWIQINDRATVGVVWTAGYSRGMERMAEDRTLTDEQKHEKAVEQADALVSDTQPSALDLDMTGLQRSEGILRLFTMFLTWQIKAGNRFRGEYRAWKENKITTRQYFRHILFEAVLSSWGALLISSILAEGDLPEWWELASAPATSMVAWVPIVRDLNSLKYGKQLGVSPVFEGVNRGVTAVKTPYDILVNDKEWSKAAWDIARAIEWQTGTPILNVVKDIHRGWENFE